jgi:hypothetical protein
MKYWRLYPLRVNREFFWWWFVSRVWGGMVHHDLSPILYLPINSPWWAPRLWCSLLAKSYENGGGGHIRKVSLCVQMDLFAETRGTKDGGVRWRNKSELFLALNDRAFSCLSSFPNWPCVEHKDEDPLSWLTSTMWNIKELCARDASYLGGARLGGV